MSIELDSNFNLIIMKNFLCKSALLFGKIFGFFFRTKYTSKVENFFHWFYTGKLSVELASLGNGSLIRYPAYIKGGEYIYIGRNFKTLYRAKIEAWDNHNGIQFTPHIQIGNDVTVSDNLHIGAIRKVTIGNNVLIGSNVLISDHNHGDRMDSVEKPPNLRPLSSVGEVFIGNNVWIGDGVRILSGVKIGDNCIIGANAVITKSFTPNSVIVGVPGKKI